MTGRTQELLQKALSLPDNERAELAGSLIASLDKSIDPDVDAAWQAEIARRAEEVRSGEVSTVPWPQAQKKARDLLEGQNVLVGLSRTGKGTSSTRAD
jgi:putative addiction module component (TIGR02574 family)